jgi:hypothetical protein
MKHASRSGAAIAIAAATLVLAGAAAAPTSHAAETKGHCIGTNACKSHGACKSAGNGCGGDTANAGKSSQQDCDAGPGTKSGPAKGG